MSYRGQRFCLLADVAVVESVVVGIAAPVVTDVAAFSDFAGAIVAAVRDVVGSDTCVVVKIYCDVAVVSDVAVVIAAVVYAESDLAVDGDDALVFVVSDVAVGGATVGNASAVYVDSDFTVGTAVDVPLKLLQFILSQSVMM